MRVRTPLEYNNHTETWTVVEQVYLNVSRNSAVTFTIGVKSPATQPGRRCGLVTRWNRSTSKYTWRLHVLTSGRSCSYQISKPIRWNI